MSLALISSSASTAACFMASTCIAFLVKAVAFNVIENRVRDQIAGAATPGQQGPDVRGGDVQSGNLPRVYGAGAVAAQEAGRRRKPLQIDLAQRTRQG